ncbi:MAG: serine/threonine protein kinase [Deltaproteobacteria bacterium]|nr:serine/threonine protein kinase [Deltaproteobacteria bacterium]
MNSIDERVTAATQDLMIPATVLETSKDTEQFYLGSRLQTLGVIGNGGMGTVLKVFHRELKVNRAVKLIDAEVLHRSHQVFERFRQEALIASEISHPNIIKVYDLDRTPAGCPFMLMELLEGMNLESLISQNAPLSLSAVIRLLAGPADALDAVHRKGVVHRDLKPANLFLTHSGTVKVLDFGISGFIFGPKDARITRDGEVVGTPLYMAPEQLTGNRLDGRADVYALGVIAYELLTGKTIFKYKTIPQLTTAIMNDTPLAPSVLNRTLAAHVDGVIARALEKEAVGRYDTALDFVRALAGHEYTHLISSVIRKELLCAIDSSEFHCLELQSHTVKSSNDTCFSQNDEQPVDAPDANTDAEQFVPNVRKKSNCSKANSKKRKWRFVVWWILLGGLAAVPGMRLLLPTTASAPHVTMTIDSVELVGIKDDMTWCTRAIRQLLGAYLSLDPNIELIDHKGVISKQQSDDLHLRLTVHATYDTQWRFAMSVQNDANETIFSKLANTAGFEDAIDELTLDLYQFVGFELMAPDSEAGGTDQSASASIEKRRQKELTTMALKALISEGLLPRVGSVTALMPPSAQRRFFDAFHAYLQCVIGESAKECMEQQPFPPVAHTGNETVDALWKLFSSANKTTTCDAIRRGPAGVRELAPVLPDYFACETSMDKICGNTDTFWRRYGCAIASAKGDSASTALNYIYSGLKMDAANKFYAGIAVLPQTGLASENGNSWFQRLVWRNGENEKSVAALHFSMEMARRHGEIALIWARRSYGAALKTALALETAGWLTEGMVQHLQLYLQMLSDGKGTPATQLEQLRHSLYPIILFKEESLANKWLKIVEESENENEQLTEALRLIAYVLDKTRGRTCRPSAFKTFSNEADYLCGRLDRIIRKCPVTVETAQSSAWNTFISADANLEKGNVNEARALFNKLESDAIFRVNYPLISISALKRLGDVAVEMKRFDDAATWYRQYLSVWGALDLPVRDYMEASRYLSGQRM